MVLNFKKKRVSAARGKGVDVGWDMGVLMRMGRFRKTRGMGLRCGGRRRVEEAGGRAWFA